MPVPSQLMVRATLLPLEPQFLDIVVGAWQDWAGSAQRGVWRCARSRATFVWEQMMARAHAAFASDERVRIVCLHETFLFLIGSNIALRFKKADESGLSSNYPTQMAIAFCDPDKDLLGLPAVARVEIVYILNTTQTAIADVLVVARDGDTIAWTYSLLEGTVAQLAAPSTEEREELAADRGKRIVRPKKVETPDDDRVERGPA